MKHSKSRLVEDADESAPVRLKTAPTVPLFGRRCFQLHLFGAVANRTYRGTKVSIYFLNLL